MASLSITIKPLSLSPSLTQRNSKPFFTYKPNANSNLNTFFSKRAAPKKKCIFAVSGERRGFSKEEIHRKIPFSDVTVVGKKRALLRRRWNYWDIIRASDIVWFHLLSLLAPFHFNWAALRLTIVLILTTGLGITLSYHRNLAHRSFNLPKWLEYFFAFWGTLAGQGDPIEWVSYHRYHHQHCDTQRDPHSPKDGFWFSHIFWIFDTDHILEKCGKIDDNVADLVKQPFYRFLQKTWILNNVALDVLLYLWGGLPFFIWGICVRKVFAFHSTFLVNSACHVWGNQVWKTNDLSKNNWLVGILALGEGWHNNHHAFEFSARHGLEWWQLDVTWYIIRFLEVIGLATDVKLPTDVQKRRMALDG